MEANKTGQKVYKLLFKYRDFYPFCPLSWRQSSDKYAHNKASSSRIVLVGDVRKTIYQR